MGLEKPPEDLLYMSAVGHTPREAFETARVFLAGDAEAREEYMAGGPYTGPLTDICPHGRPIVKRIKLEDLLREFGRL